MGIIYYFDETYTRQDMIDELESYIWNEREVFDFGEGNMKMSCSESSYYDFEINMLNGNFFREQYPDYDEYLNPSINKSLPKRNSKVNRYYINNIRQKKRDKYMLKFYSPYYTVRDRNGKQYIKRYYRGKRSKLLKKSSSRKIRTNMDYYPKGNKVKRQFDFWWELY